MVGKSPVGKSLVGKSPRTIKIVKNKKKFENHFFAKIVPEYKTPYLRKLNREL